MSELEKFFKIVISGEFQDEEDTKASSQRLGKYVCESWKQPLNSLVLLSQQALIKAINFPEHSQSAFGDGQVSVALALARAQVADLPIEIPGQLALILRVYTFDSKSRKDIRALLGSCLSVKTASVTLLKLSLEATRAILELTPPSPTNCETAKLLLAQKLLPLHSIQGKIDGTQSLLGAFHRELTLCVCKVCDLIGTSEGWEMAICDLAGNRYPSIQEGNSPKEVLFLHELEKLIADCKVQPLTGKSRSTVATRLLTSICSLHAAVSERALSFWKSDVVLQALQGSDQLLSKTCATTLAKTSLEHWSGTVKSMAGAALLKGERSTTSPSKDPIMIQAVEKAKKHEAELSNPLPPTQTFPLPKTFSSTSVIRDATEPFAVGAFGVIWKGRAIIPGTGKQQWPLVALKELDDPNSAKLEIDAMTRIGSHPNLVSLLGVFELRRGEVISLVLEYIDGPGDLHTVIIERGPLPLPACKFLSGEIGAGLQAIHSRGFVFGDMKPENILLTSEGHVKLCDFGSAFPSNNTTNTVGTVEYMPPEQVSSKFGDWWAFGCVLHFMLCGRPPVFFEKEDDSDLSTAFTRAVTFADQNGGIFVKDTAGRQLIGQLCARKPNERPIDGGESNPFFNDFRPWETLHLKKDIPKIPAEKISKAAFEKNAGPWQRRTFSTIHSPLPGVYTNLDSTFLSACVGGNTMLKEEVNFMGWEDAAKVSSLLDSAVSTIPRNRVAVTEVQSGEKDVSKGGRKVRRVQANYTVAGVDLSAG